MSDPFFYPSKKKPLYPIPSNASSSHTRTPPARKHTTAIVKRRRDRSLAFFVDIRLFKTDALDRMTTASIAT